MKLVVGLGNPGLKYEITRHNVGFRVVDELARRWQIDFGRQRFAGYVGAGSIQQQRVLLVKPTTYMNRSGRSVREAVTFYKVALEDLLVVVDDMALGLGRLRLRAKGSAGGHHGLADIIQQLGGDGFDRLRIGIDQVAGERMVGHVLSPFTAAEEEIIGPVICRAADAVECWMVHGVEEAMNRYNRAEEQTDESSRKEADGGNFGGAGR